MRRALFPGSFDPFTNGHRDIVQRAAEHFDQIYVAVLSNQSKSGFFSPERRVELIEEACRDLGERVAVGCFEGLLVEFAKSLGTNAVIRGLRAISDYDYEAQLALANKGLWPDMETFFLMSREENSYVSSTLVRQIASYGGKVAHLVPENISVALSKEFEALS